MTKEIKQIPIEAYRNIDGEPCCAKNFETGEVCVFYRTQKMGCNETCIFAQTNDKYWPTLKRRFGGTWTLIPHEKCPIWPKNS